MLIESTPPLDPHRWTPSPGLVPLDAETRAMLQRLRRRPPPRERRRRLLSWLLVAALHAFFAMALWHAMRPVPRSIPMAHAASSGESVLQVRFIPRAQPSPAAPAPPAPLPLPHRAPAHEKARPEAMRVDIPGTAPAPAASVAPAAPALFDRDGVAKLPAAAASAAKPLPGYVQRQPTGDMQVMDHRSPLPYKATRFEQYFPPPGENVLQSGLRKAVEALHGKGPSEKTVNLPRGVHLKCKTLLGIPTPMCGLPPAPPPPNDGDERLSMPSAPLAKDPHPPKPPSLERCIAAWRSQGPLPYGCPVDTPARAVDEEIRECVALYRAGKRLKTWCPADTARRAGAAGAP